MGNKGSHWIKLGLLAAVSLTVGLFYLASSSIESAKESHLNHLKERLIMLSDTVITSVNNMMLTGNAMIVPDWVKGIKNTNGVAIIQIIRGDGVEAFSDNRTINKVNRHLEGEVFPTRSGSYFEKDEEFEGFNIHPVNNDHLLEVFDGAKHQFFFETVKKQVLFTLMAPIKKSLRCNGCHGYDKHSVRAVLRISVPVANMEADLAEMKRDQLVLGTSTSLIIILLFSFYAFQLIKKIRYGEEQMRISAEVYKNAIEGIVVTDIEGTIISVNPAYEKFSGYTKKELIGKNPSILQSGRHNKEFYVEMWESLAKTGQWVGEIWNRRQDGEIFPQHISISSIKNEKGEVVQYAGMSSDITERKKQEELIEHMAYNDTLTGLPNRRTYNELVKLELTHAKRFKYMTVVMFLDLDHFKDVNDTYGHDVGDLLLQEVSAMLQGAVREGDTVSRMGGDEFTILLPQVKEASDADIIAAKIVQLFSRPVKIEDHYLKVGTSIGISIYPMDGKNVEELIKKADDAMYAAKRNGKNQYKLYSDIKDM